MTPERWAQIDRIHKEALEQAATDRSAYLDAACAGDAELRREVESLLAYATAAEGFLEMPAVQEAARSFEADVEAGAGVLPIVPGYTVIELLGTGGMGVVYLANEDPPLRRRVALKLIRPGMDSLSALARFEAERQALALMDHPNIAAVYGTGVSADRRPFVAMEFVAGKPITEYCDRARLSIRARLNMFVRVCAAVQHAHQKGVIHRDLKPSNVLVTDQEGEPVPKVIDFGTAAWADRPRGARQGLTEAGTVVGTLEYMSPEQAAASPDIDTTTDVYSLGVLLYELLVGGVPFDRQRLRQANYDEMRRVILESDPPKPSSQLTRGEPSTNSAADARDTDVGRLTRQLAGDLDWIVLRALEKDRRRRYPTVAAFAADIDRYLSDQPVDARPPSAGYRISKFARRHVGAVSAASALVVVLVAGFVTSAGLYFRAERSRTEADRQRAIAGTQRLAAEQAAAAATAGQAAAITATAESERLRELALTQVATANIALREAEYRTYVATINAADGFLRANAPTDARERLLAVAEPQRGWEWHHLFLKSDSSFATLDSSATCARPDEHTATYFNRGGNALGLASGGREFLLRRCEMVDAWAFKSLAHRTVAAPSAGAILAVNESGLMLVSERPIARVGERGQPARAYGLDLVSPDSSRARRVVGAFEVEPNCADISPDGLRIVVGLQPVLNARGALLGDIFEIWNTAPAKLVARLQPAGPVVLDLRPTSQTPCTVKFSPDGSMVATSGGTVHIWHVATGAQFAVDLTPPGYFSQPIAFSPDGTHLAVGRTTGLVDVLDLASSRVSITHLDGSALVTPLPLPETQRLTLVWARKTAEVRAITFSPDGTHIISGTHRSIRIWDLVSGRLESVREGHQATVIGVLVSADGKRIFSGDTAGAVRVWDWSPGVPAGVIRLPESSRYWASNRLSVSADRTAAATSGIDGELSEWRFIDLQGIVRPIGADVDLHTLYGLFISSEARLLFASETDAGRRPRSWSEGSAQFAEVAMRTISEQGCSDSAPGPDRFLNRFAISPNGLVLAYSVAGTTSCLSIRDIETLEVLATLHVDRTHVGNYLSAFGFRPDGTLLVASYRQDQATRGRSRYLETTSVWNWQENRLTEMRATLANESASAPASRQLVVSPDGRRVAMTGRESEYVSIWDASITREIGRLPARGIESVAFSPDGRRIVTVDRDPIVRVWDAERFQLLLTLTDTEGHEGGVAFTGDGRIIAGRTSGGLTIWESNPPFARRE